MDQRKQEKEQSIQKAVAVQSAEPLPQAKSHEVPSKKTIQCIYGKRCIAKDTYSEFNRS